MLVITRRSSESILIGDGIEIKVSEIGADKVKLCISAPKEIPIMRKELLETGDLNREASAEIDNQVISKLKSLLK